MVHVQIHHPNLNESQTEVMPHASPSSGVAGRHCGQSDGCRVTALICERISIGSVLWAQGSIREWH